MVIAGHGIRSHEGEWEPLVAEAFLAGMRDLKFLLCFCLAT